MHILRTARPTDADRCFEMETAAIYGLSRMLGHQALSTNVILANRPAGQFSPDPKKSVDQLIEYVLGKL